MIRTSPDRRVPLREHNVAHERRTAGMELWVHLHEQRHVRRPVRRLA